MLSARGSQAFRRGRAVEIRIWRPILPQVGR
jgi:hypothetical protein